MNTLHIISQAVPGLCGILFTIGSLKEYREAKGSAGLIQLCGFAIFTICELLITGIVLSTSSATAGLAQYAFVLNLTSAAALIAASIGFLKKKIPGSK